MVKFEKFEDVIEVEIHPSTRGEWKVCKIFFLSTTLRKLIEPVIEIDHHGLWYGKVLKSSNLFYLFPFVYGDRISCWYYPEEMKLVARLKRDKTSKKKFKIDKRRVDE